MAAGPGLYSRVVAVLKVGLPLIALALLDFRRQEMASQARIWPWARVDTPKDAFMRYGEQLDGAYSTTKHIQESIFGRLGITIDSPVGLDFIPVVVAAGAMASRSMVEVDAGAARVRVDVGADVEYVVALVRALRSSC